MAFSDLDWRKLATDAAATATEAGLLSARDKEKLDSIQHGAQANPQAATNAEVAAGSSDYKGRITSIDDIVAVARNFGAGGGGATYYVSPSDVGGGGAGDVPISALPAQLDIAGVLESQADLKAALEAKAAITHDHASEYAPASHTGTGGAAHATATISAAGFLSSGDKEKLDSVQHGAQPNPPSASNAEIAAGTSNNVQRATSIDDIVSIARSYGSGSGGAVYVSPSDVGGGGAGDIPAAAIPLQMDVQVQNNGSLVGARPTLNFLSGTNTTFDVVDDQTNNRVNITIGAPSLGAHTHRAEDVTGLYDRERVLQCAWSGKPVAGSRQMLMGNRGHTIRLAPNLGAGADVVGAARVSATANADFTVETSTDGGMTWSRIGVIRFAAGARRPAVVSGFGSATEIRGADVLSVASPSLQDRTLSDVVIAFTGEMIN